MYKPLRPPNSHHMKHLNPAACILFLCIAAQWYSSANAQIQPALYDSNPSIPPDAWRRMDTHGQVDPRIMRLQQQQAEEQKKSNLIAAKKNDYAPLLWQRVNQNAEWRYANGYPRAGIASAVADASHYMALRDIEGESTGRQWLQRRMSEIEATLRQQQNPNVLAIAYDTVVVGAALAGRGSQEKAPLGIGQAAGMSKAANSSASITVYHYDVLRALTQ